MGNMHSRRRRRCNRRLWLWLCQFCRCRCRHHSVCSVSCVVPSTMHGAYLVVIVARTTQPPCEPGRRTDRTIEGCTHVHHERPELQQRASGAQIGEARSVCVEQIAGKLLAVAAQMRRRGGFADRRATAELHVRASLPKKPASKQAGKQASKYRHQRQALTWARSGGSSGRIVLGIDKKWCFRRLVSRSRWSWRPGNHWDRTAPKGSGREGAGSTKPRRVPSSGPNFRAT